MSIFASRDQKTIEIPFDPPHTVTIKRLSGRHLAQAAMENQLNSIDNFRKMGGAAFQRELTAIRAEEASVSKPVEAPDPMTGYDKGVLMLHGIASWDYEGVPVSAEVLADLTEEAGDWFAREILRLSKPALFMTADEQEATAKNG